jgi:DNA-binding NarL/FixJ family response regulator
MSILSGTLRRNPYCVHRHMYLSSSQDLPLRILIADDHELIRKGVRSVLESEAALDVCGEAVNGEEAITKTVELKPDVVLMDITMPVLDGLEATRRIRRISPQTRILILTMHRGNEFLEHAQKVGAWGYVRKSEVADTLVKAIQAVLEGQTFFPAQA